MAFDLHGLSIDAIAADKPIVTRFAPSPTGKLHLGHAFAAWVARELAHKSTKGRFLLRFEDIDTPRVKPSYYDAIEADLTWLGLTWDGTPLRQSSRGTAYNAALEQLKSIGAVYPCFCTRSEILAETARMPSAPHAPDGPPYPGTCRALSAIEQKEKLDSGLAHSWRLDSSRAAQLCGPLDFTDLRFGTIHVDPTLLGDVILSRKDIGPAYHLAVVVDDAFQAITHVTRGDDLLASTHVHRLLQALLQLPAPCYLHHPLVLDDDGKRLAKRADSQAISTLRDSGTKPTEVFAKMMTHLAGANQAAN